ncbi:hypothetical protein [Pseudoalteromonas luteoviolacea]|uniref:Uncharacterized protein n=1 Tax=Pseudoalteromonas luteoviolacea H33 TaxID=1365251 RepID=A0A167BKQ7_9GAMM|nr:hypothetical protein [Pseudoalteromonas luteoviolacea]KZN46658.1 hypothetical protein N476_24210 [Pseudoalteromonas luteoviolacea H33]KZN76849.1 hypothetical protein N477_01505 [Pseudoalteromonas luteoviolacea H33-S]MBQ4880288.1 hypothetical protein [Pseudoalteromonas luteoviolacea]MBQ4909331.1 hypothetical protein [Pseudoalteromonas luteoviolacea]
MKILLILALICSFNSVANSFVAKGKIEELTLVEGREVMVQISHQPHQDDCQGNRFYLGSVSENEFHNNLMLLNTALANKYTITLHQTTGADCSKKKVYFNILRVQTY